MLERTYCTTVEMKKKRKIRAVRTMKIYVVRKEMRMEVMMLITKKILINNCSGIAKQFAY